MLTFIVCWSDPRKNGKSGSGEFDDFEKSWNSCQNLRAMGYQVSLAFLRKGATDALEIRDWSALNSAAQERAIEEHTLIESVTRPIVRDAECLYESLEQVRQLVLQCCAWEPEDWQKIQVAGAILERLADYSKDRE